jgi:hypothetical protein
MGQIPFSDAQLAKWKSMLEERSRYIKSLGSEFVFVLAPTKAFVYPEYLPEKVRMRKGYTRYEQLSDYLKKNANIHFVDLLPVLLAAKRERSYPELFYRTDFHWNFYGSFIAYRAIVSKMAQCLPQFEFEIPSLDDFEMVIDSSWYHKSFIYVVGLPPELYSKEHYIKMKPLDKRLYGNLVNIQQTGIADSPFPIDTICPEKGAKTAARVIRNKDAKLNSLIVLGDSFIEKCLHYFTANAKRVVSTRTVVEFPFEIIECEKPQIVVQEILGMYLLMDPSGNKMITK